VILGGIEAGGTKWVCAIGVSPTEILDTVVFSTSAPEATIARATSFLQRTESLDAVGIASFGPVDLRRNSPTWGRITTTPKPGWRNTDLASVLATEFAVPVGFDTDVNAAALAEHRWGAGVGLDTFVYITVGTGIGGGAIVNGQILHGLLHPEIGHMRIPHDWDRDPFAGICPYHGDCLEGLASGAAMRARFPEAEAWDDEMRSLEGEYLALGVLNVVVMFSPQRIILGGGVMRQPGLLELVRTRVREFAAGYFHTAELEGGIDSYVVAPALGDRAGVRGALELARLALAADPASPAPESYARPG
jgi:fructokinase